MNPTREEIAGWLREAAGFAELVALRDGGKRDNTILSQHYTKKQQDFLDRATQVEQSTAGRCDSCRWYEMDFCTNSENLVGNPRGDRAHVVCCGPQFGCIHWEQTP